MKGFTLIEALVYIGLFGVLMGGVVVSAYSILSGAARIEQTALIQQEAMFLDRKLQWEVSHSLGAYSTGNTLVLEPGHRAVAETGGRITVARGTAGALPLTAAALAVSDTAFTVTPSTDGVPTRVDAAFTIAGRSGSGPAAPFTFTWYLRN